MYEQSRQRSARAKKQLRDRRGRWIVEGGGITWSSASGTMYTGRARGTDQGYVEVVDVRYKDVNGRTGTLPQPARVDASKVDASPPAKARLDTAATDRDEFTPITTPSDPGDAEREQIVGSLDLSVYVGDERYAGVETDLNNAIDSQNSALDVLGDPRASVEDRRAALAVFYEDLDALRAALAAETVDADADATASSDPDPLDDVLGTTLDALDEVTDAANDNSSTADPLETPPPTPIDVLDSDVADPIDDTPDVLEDSGDVSDRGWLSAAGPGAQISFPGSDTVPPFLAIKQGDGSWKIESRASDGDSRTEPLDNSYAPDDDFFDQFFPTALKIERARKKSVRAAGAPAAADTVAAHRSESARDRDRDRARRQQR